MFLLSIFLNPSSYICSLFIFRRISFTLFICFSGVQDNSCEKKPTSAPGVNEDIINAIKAGQFTLRKAKKEKEKNQKETEQPKAVSELLNILGSLRRAPKKRQSQIFSDVQS